MGTQVSIGTSSSETASSDRGMSSTSSSEEEEEKEGEAERGREASEGAGLGRKSEMFIPREWKMDESEGLLGGGTVTGRLWDGSGARGDGMEVGAGGGGTGSWDVCCSGGGGCCCCCSLWDTRPAFWGSGWLVPSRAAA